MKKGNFYERSEYLMSSGLNKKGNLNKKKKKMEISISEYFMSIANKIERILKV